MPTLALTATIRCHPEGGAIRVSAERITTWATSTSPDLVPAGFARTSLAKPVPFVAVAMARREIPEAAWTLDVEPGNAAISTKSRHRIDLGKFRLRNCLFIYK